MWDLILSALGFSFVSQYCVLARCFTGFFRRTWSVQVVHPGWDKRKLYRFLHSLSTDEVNGEKWKNDELYWVCLPGELSGHKGRSKMHYIGAKHAFCLWSWFRYDKIYVSCFAHEFLCTYSLRPTFVFLCHHTTVMILRRMKSSFFLLLQGILILAHASSSPSLSDRAISTFSCWGCCCLCSYNSPFQLCPCACIPPPVLSSRSCRGVRLGERRGEEESFDPN